MEPTDHTALVAIIKQALEDRGVSLFGPDGAFEITKRVAWDLRDDGAGLLAKSTGNDAHGFAVDIIAYPTGAYVDCLIDAGGVNTPAWQIHSDVIDPSRWRPPSDPGDVLAPPAPPVDPPVPLPGVPLTLDEVLAKVREIVDPLVSVTIANTVATVRLSDKLAELQQNGVRFRF